MACCWVDLPPGAWSCRWPCLSCRRRSRPSGAGIRARRVADAGASPRAPRRRRAPRARRRSPRGRSASWRAAPACGNGLRSASRARRAAGPTGPRRRTAARHCAWTPRSARGTRGRRRPAPRSRRRARACARWFRAGPRYPPSWHCARPGRRSRLRSSRARQAGRTDRRRRRPPRMSTAGTRVALALRSGVRDENAGADAHFDPAGELERDDGFAHRRPRHAEQDGELALGRQPRPRRKLADCRSAWRSARRSAGTGASSPLSAAALASPRLRSRGGCNRPASASAARVGSGLYCGVGIRSSGPTTGPTSPRVDGFVSRP